MIGAADSDLGRVIALGKGAVVEDPGGSDQRDEMKLSCQVAGARFERSRSVTWDHSRGYLSATGG